MDQDSSDTLQPKGLPNLSKLVEICQDDPRIIFAVVYGSILTPYFRPDSDIDIALKVTKSFGAAEALRLGLRLGSLYLRDVNIVLISPDLSIILQDEIASKGRLLFTRDEALSEQFFIYTRLLYLDFKMTRAPLEANYIRGKKDIE